MALVTADHVVCLNAEADAQLITLGAFLDANVDGIDEEEAQDIRDALNAGRTYVGGGGAGAMFTVDLVVARVSP